MQGIRARLGRLEQMTLTPVTTGDAITELVRRLDALAARMKTNGEGGHPDGGSMNVDEVTGRLHVLLEKVAV